MFIAVAAVCLLAWRDAFRSEASRSTANAERLAAAIRSAHQGRLEKAEPLLRRELERDPENREILRALSIGLVGNDRLVEADAVLTQWYAVPPADVEPLKLRMDVRHGIALQLKPGGEQEKQKQLALEDGRQVLNLAPNDVATAKNVVLLCLARGFFDEASHVCREQLESHPEDPELFFLQGRACHSLGLNDDARRFLDQALLRSPQHAQVLMLRAILYYEGEEADKAIPLLRAVVGGGGGSNNEARYYLGLALARAGHVDEAKQVLAEVQRENFERDSFALDSLAIRVRRAELLIGCGRTDEAVELLQTVLKVDPQCASAQRLLASSRLTLPETIEPSKSRTVQNR